MNKLSLIVITLLISSSISFAQTESNTYVSLIGKFYIEYPSDWHQIPYAEVDKYLDSKKAGRPLFDYDAVFAPKSSDPYYSDAYCIMGLELVGNLSETQIDSVLSELSQEFGEGIKYFPVANFMADIQTDAPNYDKDTKTVTIYNKIVQDKTSIKNSLIIMKFYDFGIATFYCYALGDDFESNKEIFTNIVASLSIDDIKSKLPKDQVKVADIDSTFDSYSNEDDSSNVAIYILLGVVLVICQTLYFINYFKRKKRKNNS